MRGSAGFVEVLAGPAVDTVPLAVTIVDIIPEAVKRGGAKTPDSSETGTGLVAGAVTVLVEGRGSEDALLFFGGSGFDNLLLGLESCESVCGTLSSEVFLSFLSFLSLFSSFSWWWDLLPFFFLDLGLDLLDL